MQNTFDIGHLSKEDKLRVMEAIWEDLSKEDESLNPQNGIRKLFRRRKNG
jgi:hypothetical protein